MGYFSLFVPLHLSSYRFPARGLFLFALIPSCLILFFVYYWREFRNRPLDDWARPMLVAIVGLALFLSVAPAPDDVRMASISLPALILLGWLMNSPRKLVKTLVGLISVGLALTAIYAVAEKRPSPVGVLTTPQGELAFYDPGQFQQYVWMQQHTRPTDYFYEPDTADQYFYLNLRNPTPLTFIVNNGFTTTEQVADVIRGLKQHRVHYILWNPQSLDILPSWENPADDHLGPLRDYIHSSYKMVEILDGSIEVWEFKPGS